MVDTAVADRLEIRALVQRYFSGLDTRDVDVVLSTFTPDVILRYMDGALVMQGLDEARDYFAAHRGPAHLGITDLTGSTHVLANSAIEVTGDQARCRLAGLVFHRGRLRGRDVLVQRGLRYDDRLVRHDGAWLVAERLHATGWQHVSAEVASPARPPDPSSTRMPT